MTYHIQQYNNIVYIQHNIYLNVYQDYKYIGHTTGCNRNRVYILTPLPTSFSSKSALQNILYIQ